MADNTSAPSTKRCGRCKKIQEIQQFGLDRGRKDGLNVWCRGCKSKARRREYLRVKREQRFGVQLQLDLDVKTCPRCRKLKVASGFGVDRNRKGDLAPYCRDCTHIIMTALYARQSDKWLARTMKWRRENPRAASDIALRRLARKRNATIVPFTKGQLDAKWAYWAGKCWICGTTATATDHVKPLAKGGAHMLCNLRPICQPCNSRKGSRWPFDLNSLRRFAA
jgi:5-methylcytosine-specific restriction endonuclease McrA